MAPFNSALLVALSLSCLTLHSLAAPPKVISMPLSLRNVSSPLQKRDPFAASLENFLPGSSYFVTAAVGTPPQTVELVLDTGSSDAWVFDTGACMAGKSGPCLGNSYDSSQSSTSKPVTDMHEYYNKYGDGSVVQGPYYSDDFSVGGKTVHAMTIGVVNKYHGTIRSGILGMGIDKNEASYQLYRELYPSFMDSLKSQGLISSKSFSLYLDDLEESTGSVLFGGYDTEKYSGDIVMLPIQTDVLSGERITYTISLTKFGISSNDQTDFINTSDMPYPTVLDSGTTLSYIPSALFNPLVKLFGLKCQDGVCLVDCNIQNTIAKTTVDFVFANAKIAVPISELAIPLYNPNTGQAFSEGGTQLCAFGLLPQPQPGSPYILGQSFLRSAYVLYDIDGLAVGLAQAKNGVAGSNVVEYTSGAGGSKPRITTDTSEPQAKETNPGHPFVGPAVKPAVSVTIVNAAAYDNVPFPTGRPDAAFPETLTPQVTPVGGEPKVAGSGGSGSAGKGGSRSSKGGPGSSTKGGSHTTASPKTSGSASGGDKPKSSGGGGGGGGGSSSKQPKNAASANLSTGMVTFVGAFAAMLSVLLVL